MHRSSTTVGEGNSTHQETAKPLAPTPTVPALLLPLPVAVVILLMIIVGQQPDGRLHLWVLDVGQGDAILLRTPEGHTALIDGGPGATPLLNGLGEHLPFWQRNLDLLVLTHPHQDHLMGFPDLLGRYRVGQIVQTEFTSTVDLQGAWLRTVSARSVPVYHPTAGDKIGFEGEPEVDLRVLGPLDDEQDEDANEDSIVLMLQYGKLSVLLQGDAERETEMEMVQEYGNSLSSPVLKVGHHGSDTSSTAEFLNRVRPRVAIISVGADNRFGHPAPETLEALEEVGAKVYRTDLHGTVEVIADLDRMWVTSER